MFVTNLGSDWMDHPFLRQRFLVRDHDTIARIVRAGIHEVYIDLDEGIDVDDSSNLDRPDPPTPSRPPWPQTVRHASVQEEMATASVIFREAAQLMRDMMQDVRLGRPMRFNDAQRMVERIARSVARNRDALIAVVRNKDRDQYTVQHSVAVATLVVAFSLALGMSEDAVHDAGLGGLLHDIGKSVVPEEILNKAQSLSEQEFTRVKRHAEDGGRILRQALGIAPVCAVMASQHHERVDGSGYPLGLVDTEIAWEAKICAICDVYEALTSDRAYQSGMRPYEALRRIFEWATDQFDAEFVQHFVRVMGIYPVGTHVLLQSGRIGAVMEQSQGSLLAPIVRVYYDSIRNRPIKPFIADLSEVDPKGGADAVVGPIDPAVWGIDQETLA